MIMTVLVGGCEVETQSPNGSVQSFQNETTQLSVWVLSQRWWSQ